MPDPAKAVVLLSGGLDSATALAEAKAAGFAVHALTIGYGQRHAVELAAARRVARALGVAGHVEQTIDLRAFGGSALTGDLEVPKDRPADVMAAEIPITYVPARNTVFLALGPGLGREPGCVRHLPRRELRRLLGLSRLPPRIPSRLRGAGEPGDTRGRRGRGPIPHPCPPARAEQGADHHPGARARGRFRPDAQLLRPHARGRLVWPLRRLLPSARRLRTARADRPRALCESDEGTAPS